MADQEEPLLKEEAEGTGDDTVAESGVQGPVLNLDLIISRLLGYKEKPGKQVHTITIDIILRPAYNIYAITIYIACATV